MPDDQSMQKAQDLHAKLNPDIGETMRRCMQDFVSGKLKPASDSTDATQSPTSSKPKRKKRP